MNYLAHALRFLDRPDFVAGAAVPDWLSAADRQVRLRPQQIEPWLRDDDPQLAEIAAGVRQHHDDDGWFHATRGFAEVTGELACLFREAVGTDGFRCGFLGHIVTEMLLDAVLIDQEADRLRDYHATLDQVDADAVERAVNVMSRVPARRLADFIRLFQRERILESYQDSRGLMVRLNQVLRRVKLTPLPESGLRVLDDGRRLVGRRVDDLLPPDRFPLTASSRSSPLKDSLP